LAFGRGSRAVTPKRVSIIETDSKPFLSIVRTVDSKERAGAKKFFSIFDETLLSKRFLITRQYAFCSALNALSYELLFNYFARNVAEKIRDQEKRLCRLAVHCGKNLRNLLKVSHIFKRPSKDFEGSYDT
jgi:hypothetical protein